jgi:hypothetical protein
MRLRENLVLSRPQSLSRRASPGYDYFADAHHLASLDVIRFACARDVSLIPLRVIRQ